MQIGLCLLVSHGMGGSETMVVSGVREFHGKVARSLYAVITLI